MGIVVPIRFKEDDLSKIDALVEAGMFKSRSEAIRRLSISAAKDKDLMLLGPENRAIVKSILRVLKAHPPLLQITLEQDITKYLTEGRERL